MRLFSRLTSIAVLLMAYSPAALSSPPPATSPSAVEASVLGHFQLQYQQDAKTPQGAAERLLQALVMGLENPTMAEAYLSVVLRSDELTAAPSRPGGYTLSATGKFMWQQFQQKPHIVYSYVGATPDQGYHNFNPKKLVFNFPADGEMVGQIRVDNSAVKAGATTGRIYIKSSGKDFPTPINMDKNRDGIWKIRINSLSNLATGVRPGTANAGNF